MPCSVFDENLLQCLCSASRTPEGSASAIDSHPWRLHDQPGGEFQSHRMRAKKTETLIIGTKPTRGWLMRVRMRAYLSGLFASPVSRSRQMPDMTLGLLQCNATGTSGSHEVTNAFHMCWGYDTACHRRGAGVAESCGLVISREWQGKTRIESRHGATLASAVKPLPLRELTSSWVSSKATRIERYPVSVIVIRFWLWREVYLHTKTVTDAT